MKKILICNISMNENTHQTVYTSTDSSLPVSCRAVTYPVTAFLEATIAAGTELKVILLTKSSQTSCCTRNAAAFKEELELALAGKGVTAQYVEIDTPFSQKSTVHEELMGRIVKEIEDGSHIIADITYGSKDLPIIQFSALAFAEKFLSCEIEQILYGQAEFVNGKPVNTQICDMSPLFYLQATMNAVKAPDADKARKMLDIMLTM